VEQKRSRVKNESPKHHKRQQKTKKASNNNQKEKVLSVLSGRKKSPPARPQKSKNIATNGKVQSSHLPPLLLQPSYPSTLLRTQPEFIIKLILFISIEQQNGAP
jgi:hypothetical protein